MKDEAATIEHMAKQIALGFGWPEDSLDKPHKETTTDARAIHHEKLWHMFEKDARTIYFGLKAMGVRAK